MNRFVLIYRVLTPIIGKLQKNQTFNSKYLWYFLDITNERLQYLRYK